VGWVGLSGKREGPRKGDVREGRIAEARIGDGQSRRMWDQVMDARRGLVFCSS
jgi:hypothetical protein